MLCLYAACLVEEDFEDGFKGVESEMSRPF